MLHSHSSKISGWQQTKNSLRKWICNVSNLIRLIQFHLICQMLAKFSGVESKRTVLKKFRKRRRKFPSNVFTCSTKHGREIRKFHVAVVQWRLRNVQKSMMQMQSYCFAKKSYCILTVLVAACPLRHCLNSLLLWSRNFATKVTWRHTSLCYSEIKMTCQRQITNWEVLLTVLLTVYDKNYVQL